MIRASACGLAVVACFTACSGSAGPAGAKGPAGKTGAQGLPGSQGGPSHASVSAIIPDVAYLARSSDVTISGYATTWSLTTRVDLGAGITVTGVHPASPTSLIVGITIDATAATGLRDVTVSDGDAVSTYSAGFDVEPPMTLTWLGETSVASLAYLDVQVTDLATPLDTTSTTDALGQVTYPNLALVLPAGVATLALSNVSAYSARALLTIDLDTVPATSALDLVSGPPGGTTDTHFPVPQAISVGPRTPTPLASGSGTAAVIEAPYDSGLYSFMRVAASG
jgi:Quinohemoprotein amine dehydrogenase, alpha subunit domain III